MMENRHTRVNTKDSDAKIDSVWALPVTTVCSELKLGQREWCTDDEPNENISLLLVGKDIVTRLAHAHFITYIPLTNVIKNRHPPH